MVGCTVRAWALTLAVGPAGSGAADSELRLRWSAPEGCASETSFRAKVDEYRLDAPIPDGGVDVRVDIEQTDGGWTVALQVLLEQGVLERSFDASSCETGLDAAALMVAISLDPEAVADQLEPRSPAPEPETEPAPEPEPEPEPEPAPAPASPGSPIGFVGQLGGLVGLGELPGVGGGVSGSAGVRIAWSRLEATAIYGPPRRALVSVGLGLGEAGADVSMWAIGARACGEPRLSKIAFPLCVGGEGGELLGDGVGLEQSRRGRVRWGALTATAGVSYVPTRVFGLFARAEGGIALTRLGFMVDDVGVVHRPAPALFRAVAGVEFRWPNNLWAGRPRQR